MRIVPATTGQTYFWGGRASEGSCVGHFAPGFGLTSVLPEKSLEPRSRHTHQELCKQVLERITCPAFIYLGGNYALCTTILSEIPALLLQ